MNKFHVTRLELNARRLAYFAIAFAAILLSRAFAAPSLDQTYIAIDFPGASSESSSMTPIRSEDSSSTEAGFESSSPRRRST